MRWLALFLLVAAPAAHAEADAWRGGYAGVNAGYVRAHSTWITDATTGPPATETVDQTGGSAIAGLQAGYRFAATDHLLLAFELQGHGPEIETKGPSTLASAPGRERITRIRTPMTAALVAGIAGEKSLVYLRGGYAYATLKLEAINHNVGNIAIWEYHATGWTAGAGLERKVGKRWSVGFEYDYLKLDAVDLSTTNNGGAFVQARSFEAKVHLALLRANYRF